MDRKREGRGGGLNATKRMIESIKLQENQIINWFAYPSRKNKRQTRLNRSQSIDLIQFDCTAIELRVYVHWHAVNYLKWTQVDNEMCRFGNVLRCHPPIKTEKRPVIAAFTPMILSKQPPPQTGEIIQFKLIQSASINQTNHPSVNQLDSLQQWQRQQHQRCLRWRLK